MEGHTGADLSGLLTVEREELGSKTNLTVIRVNIE
jgi:hypothetical protein